MHKYDVGIIGAGIAGSCLALQLAKAGKKVVIAEQHSYPKHKVCGEFISNESFDYLCSLGLNLGEWDLPSIKQLELSSEKGCEVLSKMDVGGFGISRYKLDYELSKLFSANGIEFLSDTKVNEATATGFNVNGQPYSCELVIGAHGKYRASYNQSAIRRPSRNFIGVKYHIRIDRPADLISLHSFDGGYCGMSKVENNTYCLCYLIDSKHLKQSNNSIIKMEQEILFKNHKIKAIYEDAEFLWEKPLIISNIQFGFKKTFDTDFIYVGDAASSISPLSGNGMSIAAASAQMLSDLILSNSKDLRSDYNRAWKSNFYSRVRKARLLNTIMLNSNLHHLTLNFLKSNPRLLNQVVNAMQGETIESL